MTVLLTGFAPFGGSATNPSWRAAGLVAGRRDDVVAVELPVEFGASLPALRAAIEAHGPDLVVCAGEAGGRDEVTPERVAINVVDARIPDNAGRQPVDVPVVAGGPAAYFTTLPVKAAVAAIQARGVPAAVSYTAGTYVCNQVFYGLMHLLATDFPALRGGFVHVPSAPEQVACGEPALAVEESATALEAVIDAALTTSEDLHVAAGTLN
ncbi:pyroglutamyl-peptidase I [Amycolatopsis sp. FDAARGOS 1241]|uniref:pyroglutamyl-peptidase I n=1 Tax=Amycolatopsis sp. FDAARGOS 1241 TaxID=2778070 RepID=UPI0019525B17|nr:pyroglutamyl-peptidase I [Amycolatopsis sp. FDAARGOS 1241]QRP46612.1 pyroglutamyl-peptidase I [Amycolatopsis sp. FDAARGOS 1241]